MTTLLQTEFAILVLAICFRFFMRIQIEPRPGIQGHHGDGDEACPANNEHDGERDLHHLPYPVEDGGQPHAQHNNVLDNIPNSVLDAPVGEEQPHQPPE